MSHLSVEVLGNFLKDIQTCFFKHIEYSLKYKNTSKPNAFRVLHDYIPESIQNVADEKNVGHRFSGWFGRLDHTTIHSNVFSWHKDICHEAFNANCMLISSYPYQTQFLTPTGVVTPKLGDLCLVKKDILHRAHVNSKGLSKLLIRYL